MTGQYRALSACPVCGEPLTTTRLGCHHCGSELVGDFAPCPFCALDDAELDILRVFLASRGNMREVEKHLAVSYPTARARFNTLLGKLGLADTAAEDEPHRAEPDAAASEGAGPDAEAHAPESGTDGEPEDGTAPDEAGTLSARDQILAQVASGALSPELAADLLRRLGNS